MYYVDEEYFTWLCKHVATLDGYPKGLNADSLPDQPYILLLHQLYNIPFYYIHPRDVNREADGLALRKVYERETMSDIIFDRSCSVLEMMVALAIRCESAIMSNESYGDRTADWFWAMIESLGLDTLTDGNYDEILVDDIISNALERNYSATGRGGWFTVINPPKSMREVEIWYQLMYYLSYVLNTGREEY